MKAVIFSLRLDCANHSWSFMLLLLKGYYSNNGYFNSPLEKKTHKDRERYKFKCNFLKEYNEIPENYNPQIFDLRINTISETVVGVTH